MSCKGICEKYRAKRKGTSWYTSGFSRCQTCELFLDVDGSRCPCCSCLLRMTPKNAKHKKRLRSENR